MKKVSSILVINVYYENILYIFSRRALEQLRIECYRVLAFPFQSPSTRTSSSSLFRFLDARVIRRTFCITRLFSYLLESWRAERRSRAPSSARLYLSFSLSSRLSHYVSYSFSFLLRDLRLPLTLARSHPDPADHPDAVVETIRHNNGQT